MLIAYNLSEDMAEVDEFGRGKSDCKLCGRTMRAEMAYEKMGICGPCAARAGNAYLVAHGGAPNLYLAPEEYREWQDKRAAERAGKYQKKVIPSGLRIEVFERDAYRCKSCGDHKNLRADHVIPERNGGPTTLENLQTLCQSCNSKKGWR